MTDISIDFMILIIFFIAGFVKGTIGLGLPTTSLALITLATNILNAMSLLLVPSLVTNFWQAVRGESRYIILERLWPFFIITFVMVLTGTFFIEFTDPSLLSIFFGILLIIYASGALSGLQFKILKKQETFIGLLAGGANGLLTGITGSFVFPGVLYLQAIGLSRDELIQAMGILFLISTIALALGLKGNGFLTLDQFMWSTIAVGPTVLGMMLGQKIRKYLSDKAFHKVFFLALFLLGFIIIFKSITLK